MSYIGVQIENRFSPNFIKEDFVGNGSDTVFTLTNEVPGGASENVMVMVNNVVQEFSMLHIQSMMTQIIFLKFLHLLERLQMVIVSM